MVTSSNAATFNLEGDGYVITEKDWNEYDPRVVTEKGKDAPAASMYRASKTLAERAAWEFMKRHKDEIKFDLVTILPPWVYGVSRNVVTFPELELVVDGFVAHTSRMLCARIAEYLCSSLPQGRVRHKFNAR